MPDLWATVPLQIARAQNGAFVVMNNGTRDQSEFVDCTSTRELMKRIRFGAFDGLIRSWEKKIRVVSSMGKQSTGKSYMCVIVPSEPC